MNELLKILNYSCIDYSISDYAGNESILIKKNKYQIEIYYKYNIGYVRDLHNIPYTWGIMGSTTLSEIIEDLKEYLKIDITNLQLSLF